MFRQLPQRKSSGRLFVGAAAALAIVVSLVAGGIGSYVSASRWIVHTLEVRRELNEWLIALLDCEASARVYGTGGDPAALAAYGAAREAERVSAQMTRALIADNPTQIANVERADAEAVASAEELDAVVAAERQGRRDEAVARLASRAEHAPLHEFRRRFRAIRAEEDRLLTARRAQARSRGWVTLTGAVLLTLVSSGFLGLAWRRERKHEGALAKLASDARARLAGVCDLASTLSEARTRSQVVDAVLAGVQRFTGVHVCALHLLEDGAFLATAGLRGAPSSGTASSAPPIFRSDDPAVSAALASSEGTWVEYESADAPSAALLPKTCDGGPPVRSHWVLPVVAEGRALGLLSAGFCHARVFSPDEREFVATIAKQAGQALLRAARLQREDEARGWLATTLRSIGDAVIATDPEGRVAFMNPVAERLTGWTEAEARRASIARVFDAVSDEEAGAAEDPIQRVLREGTRVGMGSRVRLRPRSGPEIPIHDSGAPIVGEDGRVYGVVLVFRDATAEERARVQAEFLARAGEALASCTDHEQSLATIAGLAVPTFADGCAVDVTEGPPERPAVRRVALVHRGPGRGRQARAELPAAAADPDAAAAVAQALRTGQPSLYELRGARLTSAMIVPLSMRGRVFGAMTFVQDESGRRYGPSDLAFAEDLARRAGMAVENVSALERAERSRAQEHLLRGEAELASRAKDEFLATVSHELRTPLNAILGWTVMLRRRHPPAEIDRALAVIERNARAQTMLIEDVLDVSRIISGKLVLKLGPTNVRDTLVAAVETVTPAATAKDIELCAEVDDPSLTITADADRLQQIVWNLLSNAVKFTPKGGQVSVSAARRGSDLCIRVVDNGEGMRPEVLPLIFEPFQQADASTTRQHGGLGLGLAIVKQLVVAHGGSVHAESEGEGRGAAFVVDLPARRSATDVVRTLPPSARTLAGASSSEPRSGLEGMRVLVVDDEQDALDIVAEVLRQQGAEVHLAASVDDALETFGRVRPDVVVSDIGMPHRDGYALIRRIRSLSPERGGRTPAVALTAYARSEDADRAFAAGYQMHVTKPVEPVRLAMVVARAGGRSPAAAGA